MSNDYVDWLNGLSKLYNKREHYSKRKTAEQYQNVKNKGFQTVKWQEFNLQVDDFDNMIQSVDLFLQKNSPCLFIYDPLKDNLTKNFLFGINSIDSVNDWVEKNKNDIFNYSYLITSKISREYSGYIGSAHSDGKGKLIIETYHEPFIDNHRVLSQNSKNKLKPEFLDHVVVDNYEIISQDSRWLKTEDITELIDHYAFEKGFFDFIKGTQYNKLDIYTIDINDIVFKEFFVDSFYFDIRKRLNRKINK